MAIDTVLTGLYGLAIFITYCIFYSSRNTFYVQEMAQYYIVTEWTEMIWIYTICMYPIVYVVMVLFIICLFAWQTGGETIMIIVHTATILTSLTNIIFYAIMLNNVPDFAPDCIVDTIICKYHDTRFYPTFIISAIAISFSALGLIFSLCTLCVCGIVNTVDR